MISFSWKEIKSISYSPEKLNFFFARSHLFSFWNTISIKLSSNKRLSCLPQSFQFGISILVRLQFSAEFNRYSWSRMDACWFRSSTNLIAGADMLRDFPHFPNLGESSSRTANWSDQHNYRRDHQDHHRTIIKQTRSTRSFQFSWKLTLENFPLFIFLSIFLFILYNLFFVNLQRSFRISFLGSV